MKKAAAFRPPPPRSVYLLFVLGVEKAIVCESHEK